MLYSGIVDQTDIDAVSGFEPVELSKKHFGVNALINNAIELNDSFSELASDLSLSTLRYPGGTVTEKFFRIDKFNGVDFDVIVDSSNSTLLGFEEFLDLASAVDQPISIVIPTKYGLKLSGTDAPHTTAGEALIADRYGERVPSDEYIGIVASFVSEAIRVAAEKNVKIEAFEIGNEFWSGGEMTAIEYGRLASLMSMEMQEAMSDLELDEEPQIIVQSISSAGFFSPRNDKTVWVNEANFEVVGSEPEGPGWTETIIDVSHASGGDNDWRATDQREALIEIFEAEPNSVDAIDGIVEHYYETGGFSKVDSVVKGSFQEDFTGLFAWEDLLGKDFDFHISEWNVQRSGSNNRGLEHASMLVEMLYEMSTHGVQSAQAWPLFSQDTDSTALYIDGDVNRLSFAGHSFSMMSESLVGLTPFLDFESADGVLDIHGFEDVRLSDSFSGTARQVYFVSSRVAEAQHDISLDLRALAPFSTTETNGLYYVTISNLSDGDGDGKSADSLPVLSYSNAVGYTLEELASIGIGSEWGAEGPGSLDGYSLTKIEITYVSDQDDVVFGRSGQDELQGLSGDDTVSSGEGEDTIDGGAGNDVISAGSGNDSVIGGLGRDWVALDAGNDFFRDDADESAQDNDTVFGGAGNDTINGDGGADTFYGEDGRDLIIGGSGNDALFGGGQFDTIQAGAGDDVVEGNLGSDTVYLDDGADVFIDDPQNNVWGQDTVYGGRGDDTINGDGGDDEFYGDEGRDLIFGGSGNDILFGGGQKDTIRGGLGNDTVYGNLGNDLVYLEDGDDVFNDDAQHNIWGKDTVFGGAGRDTINGAGGDDAYYGGAGEDSILGGAGNDLIFGGGQSDTLRGGEGADTIEGGLGRDQVYLDDGDDTFIDDAQTGDFGRDTVTGGLGSDKFVFKATMSEEVITDFELGLDRLVLDTGGPVGARSASEIITDFAQLTPEGVLFAFSPGASILLEGLSSTINLETSIDLL